MRGKNLLPLSSSLFYIAYIVLHASRLVLTEFLYATLRRFLSSLDNSYPVFATCFMYLIISSYLSPCSDSLAKYMLSSLDSAISFLNYI